MIKAILFDLDETIILDESVTAQALREAAALAGEQVGADPERLAADVLRIAARLWQAGPHFPYSHRIGHSAGEGLWARYDAADSPAALREWASGYRLAAWTEALAEQSVADERLAAELAGRFMFYRRHYPRFPEIDEVLARLRPRYALGIVTNGVPDLQREKIAGCGVADLFQATIISGEIDCGKPDPGIFRFICGKLGVEPAEVAMVGDNPERDVAGAIAAGMKSVWVQRNGRARDSRYPADLECTNLLAMLDWLGQ